MFLLETSSTVLYNPLATASKIPTRSFQFEITCNKLHHSYNFWSDCKSGDPGKQLGACGTENKRHCQHVRKVT